MAEKKKMTVAEILAAARGADGGAGAADEPAASEATPVEEAPVADSPAAEASAPAAPAGKVPPPGAAGRPSVSDILAMARNKGAAAAPKAEAKPKAEKKPAAKPKAVKAAPAGKAAPPQRSTASILAAARGSDTKPGPMSKAEAAAKAPAAKSKPAKKAKAPLVAPPMPEKPGYAKAKPAPVADGESRRGFMAILFGTALAGGMSLLAITGGLFSLALARFMFPNVLTEPPSQFKVGFPDAFAFGTRKEKPPTRS